MTTTLIDTHCHLDFEDFDIDREQVINSALDKGIKKIIIPATRRSGWQKIKDLCENDRRLYPCYGLHPYWTDTHEKTHISELESWATDDSCFGIGECGLDYREGQAEQKAQLQLFEAQLVIARDNDLPVAIHSINATEDIIKLIKKYPGIRGKMHSYSGSYQQALTLIELGFYISFGGTITYENATKHRNTASKLPLESLMLESNAPDQPDSAHKYQRNEPAYMIEVLRCLSELRCETVEDIAETTTANALRLFKL